jgi:hypothetical protein
MIRPHPSERSPRRRRFVALLLAGLAVGATVVAVAGGDSLQRAAGAVQSAAVRIAAPVLADWIAGRRDALGPAGAPPPPAIVARLSGYFPESTIRRTRHHVGWPGGLPGLVFRLSDSRAIALDHVIVFRDAAIAADPVIWAHELAHVCQFDLWGMKGFAERYLLHHRQVEREAWQVAIDYKMWALQAGKLE